MGDRRDEPEIAKHVRRVLEQQGVTSYDDGSVIQLVEFLYSHTYHIMKQSCRTMALMHEVEMSSTHTKQALDRLKRYFYDDYKQGASLAFDDINNSDLPPMIPGGAMPEPLLGSQHRTTHPTVEYKFKAPPAEEEEGDVDMGWGGVGEGEGDET